MSIEQYDAIVIGSGKAGKTLAPALTAAGLKTALIERRMDRIGGGCINIACIPTKTLVASASVAQTIRDSAAYGIKTPAPTVDMSAVIQRKRTVVQAMREMNLHNLKKALGDDLVIGTGRFTDLKTVEVNTANGKTRLLAAEKIFINTGTRPFVPDILGLPDAGYLTNETIMELEQRPEHLLILGGGYVGLEFAQMFRRFGSQVTVIERSANILSKQDPDIAALIQTILEREDIKLLTKTKVVSVERTGNSVSLRLQQAEGEKMLHGSHLLVALGRTPNTEGLNLAATGVTMNQRGFVVVNDRLETNVPEIWALGDVNGGPQFTHISLDDYRIIKANVLDGKSRSTRDRLIPSALFIEPELAQVGLTQTEANQQGYAIRVAKLEVSAIPRARTLGKTEGIMKAIVDAKTDRILGCTLLCAQAGEVITTVQMVMQAQLPYTVLRDGVLTHPTMTEGLNLLFANL